LIRESGILESIGIPSLAEQKKDKEVLEIFLENEVLTATIKESEEKVDKKGLYREDGKDGE